VTTLSRNTTNVYPTRYAAFEHPGAWAVFEPIDGLYRPCTKDAKPRPVADLRAYQSGGALAVIYLPQQNEHFADIVDGTYVEVIKNADGRYFARCHHTRPIRSREQVNATVHGASMDDVLAKAEQWIAGLGRGA
jgi:hypothetical protein